jgi:hypothetical protein
MPLDATGEIEYTATPDQGGIRYQNNPPVCNLCKQEITRENVGWMYLEGGRHPRRRVQDKVECKIEFIECRGCTMLRAGGPLFRHFLKRHSL